MGSVLWREGVGGREGARWKKEREREKGEGEGEGREREKARKSIFYNG